MARYKDVDWGLPSPRVQTWEQVNAAVLMDIRDELKRLNRLLYCHNFLGMPNTLREIEKNTKRPRRKTTKRQAS